MKTILVATDFSPAAFNAAEYAADMAMAIKGELLLLNVYKLPLNYADAPMIISMNDLQEITEKDMSDFKTKLLKKKRDQLNIRTEVRMGTFFNELKNKITDKNFLHRYFIWSTQHYKSN